MGVTYSGVPLEQVVKQLNDFDITVQGQIEKIALVSRSIIMERLQVHLKTGADHFDVTIRPNLLGYTITVGAIDEIGVFLFQGVKEHEITGVAMPLGNGQFAEVVHHPGFDPRSELVWRAVVEGIAIAMEAVDLV